MSSPRAFGRARAAGRVPTEGVDYADVGKISVDGVVHTIRVYADGLVRIGCQVYTVEELRSLGSSIQTAAESLADAANKANDEARIRTS